MKEKTPENNILKPLLSFLQEIEHTWNIHRQKKNV